MIYVLENENSVEISMEASAESSAVVEESTENVESSAVIEAPKAWPKGSVESFTDHALPTLVFGMLGIFLVLGLISLATIGLNKLFPGKKD
ncbi:MAG: hypothetical protein E7614_01860 [Ruminococcaceae bacterium]|nr:hypothetical protein [Oscillospiraceae bacterium]